MKNKNVNHSKALIFQYGASADGTAESNIQHSDVFWSEHKLPMTK